MLEKKSNVEIYLENQFIVKEDLDEHKEIQGKNEISDNDHYRCNFKVNRQKSFNISYSILTDYISCEELPTTNSKDISSNKESFNKFYKTSQNKIQNKFKVNPKLTHSGSSTTFINDRTLI